MSVASIGQKFPLELLGSVLKLATQVGRLLFSIAAAQTPIFVKSEGRLPVKSRRTDSINMPFEEHSFVFKSHNEIRRLVTIPEVSILIVGIAYVPPLYVRPS